MSQNEEKFPKPKDAGVLFILKDSEGVETVKYLEEDSDESNKLNLKVENEDGNEKNS